MTDRSVVVRLRAEVDGFKRGMAEAAAAAKKTGEESRKGTEAAATATQRLTQSATKNREAWEKSGKAMLITGAALGAGIAITVKTFMDFDAAMSQVKTLSHATAGEMDQLTNAALTMGQGIGFTATQTAEAETELVKAGLSVKDIMGGALVGALNLAAAGQIDVGKATEIAAAAMTQFKLSGKDVPHIADLLAAGADKALGSVGDLGYALSSSGTVAAQFGLSIEETVGTLAEFAQNAQIGERGGTLLRQMLLQLVNPSKQAKDIMQQYGFSLYDANGKMVGTSALAGRLQKSFGSLTPEVKNHALAVLFGSHAIAGANILMSDGAKVNAEWVKSVNDSGFAAQQAAGKMDNLKGDLNKLRAALESDLIKTGSQANNSLRSMTQGVTNVAKAYGSLPAPIQGAILGLTGLVAVTALAGGAFLTVVPRIIATRNALFEMGVTAEQTSLALKALGGAGLVLAVADIGTQLANVAGRATVATVNVDSLAHSLQNLAKGGSAAGDLGHIFDTGWSFSPFRHEVSTTSEALKEFSVSAEAALGSNFSDKLDRIGGGQVGRFGKQVEQIDSALAQMVTSGNIQGATKAYGDLMGSITAANKAGAHIPVQEVADKFGKYQAAVSAAADATKKQAEAAAKSLPPTREQADAMRLLGGASSQTSEEVKALAKQMQDFESAVAKSFASATNVIGNFQADTSKGAASIGTQLAKSFRSTTKEAQKFATDVQLAVKRGLNPAVTEQLLEAGPKQAGPILQAMVHDHSGRLIKMANQSATALGKIQAQVVEEARLTNLAMTASTDTMTHDLASAMKISEAEASTGGQRTARALSKQLGIGAADVKRIAAEFGISLAAGVKRGTDSAGGSVGHFQGIIRQTPTHHQTDFTVAGIRSAEASVAAFRRMLTTLPTQKVVQLLYETRSAPGPGIAAPRKHADGGLVGGTGGPRSDNQLILASPGEFVVNAKAYSENAALVQAINASRYADGGMVTAGAGSSARMFAGAVPRYADGGRVAAAASTGSGAGDAGPQIVYRDNAFYSYDPHDIVREQQAAARDAAAVYNLAGV